MNETESTKLAKIESFETTDSTHLLARDVSVDDSPPINLQFKKKDPRPSFRTVVGESKDNHLLLPNVVDRKSFAVQLCACTAGWYDSKWYIGSAALIWSTIITAILVIIALAIIEFRESEEIRAWKEMNTGTWWGVGLFTWFSLYMYIPQIVCLVQYAVYGIKYNNYKPGIDMDQFTEKQ
jgi:hypothetical protein